MRDAGEAGTTGFDYRLLLNCVASMTSRMAEFSRWLSPPFPIPRGTPVGRLVPSDLVGGRPASAHDRHTARPDRLRSSSPATDGRHASRERRSGALSPIRREGRITPPQFSRMSPRESGAHSGIYHAVQAFPPTVGPGIRAARGGAQPGKSGVLHLLPRRGEG